MRLLALRDVIQKTRRSRSKIYTDMAEDPPAFPRPAVRDGVRFVRWTEEQIDDYIRDLIKKTADRAAKNGEASDTK
jgi:predicted DNA-binding transcriptional regulator AlpA